MLAPTLAILILGGYGVALWWLLRREAPTVLLLLLALCCFSLSLRFLYTTDYPRGMYEDEPNHLEWSMVALEQGRLFGESRVLIPVLLGALFEGQLVPFVGPTRWAARSYSMATSVLATPAAFAVARAAALGPVPSIAAGALVAVLPPELFYGRIHLGGELIFHELLLLAALALIVFRGGGWREVALGGFALCLLLYDYWAGRAMLAMPVAAAALTRSRRQQRLCLAIVVVALVGYVPYLLNAPPHAMRGVTDRIRPELYERPLHTLTERFVVTARTLVYPEANDGWGTIRTAAMHPPLVLGLGVLGLLVPPLRRGLFLLAGLLGGLAPAVLSDGAPSAHRMLMAFPFIALAAACPFEILRYRGPQVVVTMVLVSLITAQSLRLYFSPEFWPTESRWLFDWERTEVIEALPPAPHPKFIVMQQVDFYFKPRAFVDANYEMLTAENWYPPDQQPTIYLIDWSAAPLRPFYESLLGAERVQGVGRAFLLHFAAGEWSWMRRHGWIYDVYCTDGRSWHGQVPTLYQHAGMHFRGLNCSDQRATHVWHARWTGPATVLRFRFTGTATVDGEQGRLAESAGFEKSVEFQVRPDMLLTLTLSAPFDRPFLAELVEITPVAERVPPWEYVTPWVPADTGHRD